MKKSELAKTEKELEEGLKTLETKIPQLICISIDGLEACTSTGNDREQNEALAQFACGLLAKEILLRRLKNLEDKIR